MTPLQYSASRAAQYVTVTILTVFCAIPTAYGLLHKKTVGKILKSAGNSLVTRIEIFAFLMLLSIYAHVNDVISVLGL